jgi:hypothetical protein
MGVARVGGRGRWFQKSSSKLLSPKLPMQGQMTQNTKEKQKLMLAD